MASGINNLEQALNDIINNAVDIANDVVRNVGGKVKTDIYDKANKTLEAYYADYTPHIYKRTYSLKRAIKPYTQEMQSGGMLTLEIGVEYDSSRLDGIYESNSYYHQDGGSWVSRYNNNFDHSGTSNGIPEADWILNNFLEGLHPITTVSKTVSKNGKTSKKYTYSPYSGATHPLKLMQEFVDREIEPKVQAYVQEELWNVISDYF